VESTYDPLLTINTAASWKKRSDLPPRPFLALEVGPRLPYTYPQCMPANSRHATRPMKEPRKAKRHLGQSLHRSNSHRPVINRRSFCAAARSAHTGTQIGPRRATSRPDGRKETNPAITSRQSPANGQHAFDRPIRLGRKRGLAPFVRSIRRTVPAKGACPLFRIRASEALPLRRHRGQG
jgi:hypothetical protein